MKRRIRGIDLLNLTEEDIQRLTKEIAEAKATQDKARANVKAKEKRRAKTKAARKQRRGK